VERGVRKVDRMSVLETLAAALEVPRKAWELTHAGRYTELSDSA